MSGIDSQASANGGGVTAEKASSISGPQNSARRSISSAPLETSTASGKVVKPEDDIKSTGSGTTKEENTALSRQVGQSGNKNSGDELNLASSVLVTTSSSKSKENSNTSPPDWDSSPAKKNRSYWLSKKERRGKPEKLAKENDGATGAEVIETPGVADNPSGATLDHDTTPGRLESQTGEQQHQVASESGTEKIITDGSSVTTSPATKLAQSFTGPEMETDAANPAAFAEEHDLRNPSTTKPAKQALSPSIPGRSGTMMETKQAPTTSKAANHDQHQGQGATSHDKQAAPSPPTSSAMKPDADRPKEALAQPASTLEAANMLYQAARATASALTPGGGSTTRRTQLTPEQMAANAREREAARKEKELTLAKVNQLLQLVSKRLTDKMRTNSAFRKEMISVNAAIKPFKIPTGPIHTLLLAFVKALKDMVDTETNTFTIRPAGQEVQEITLREIQAYFDELNDSPSLRQFFRDCDTSRAKNIQEELTRVAKVWQGKSPGDLMGNLFREMEDIVKLPHDIPGAMTPQPQKLATTQGAKSPRSQQTHQKKKNSASSASFYMNGTRIPVNSMLPL